jgi:early secretory antigenic target protein ESAT-6
VAGEAGTAVADGEIAVAFDVIEDAAAGVRNVAANIYEQLDDLTRAVAPIVAEWTGEAAEQYQYQHKRWMQASTDLHLLLLRAAAQLDNANESFAATEESVRRLWA